MTKVKSSTIQIQNSSDPMGETRQGRQIQATQVIFDANELNVFDVNLKRRSLQAMGQDVSDDSGIFLNEQGVNAYELINHPDFSSVTAVSGGMYFSKDYRADAFLWFKPSERYSGRLLAAMNSEYSSGGFFAITSQGEVALTRRNDFSFDSEQGEVCLAEACQDIGAFRMIAQSNLILVKDGIEDGNLHSQISERSALVLYKNQSLGIVSTQDQITLAEFGHLLVKLNVQDAINLDGGPSTQLTTRRSQNAPVKKVLGWENQEEPSRMPMLFTIE